MDNSPIDMNINDLKAANTFPSMDALATAKNIDKELLKIAKKRGAPGFSINGRIYWLELEQWWNDHLSELEEVAGDNLTVWKTRKTKADALKSELELEEMQENFLVKDEVKSFLKQIASAQLAFLKSKLISEVPPKILGLSLTETEVVMSQVVQDTCAIFQKSIKDWTK